MNLRCLVLGHKYLEDAPAQQSEDSAPFWTCRRCGRRTYTAPRDPSGSDIAGGSGDVT